MNDPFDPYRKWLGIPPQDRPPHHYRLLGIEPMESDPDVIATAADGRMAQIKNFQTGEHSAASQKILNEIAAAKICLLNAEKKAAYDRKLRHRLEAERKGIPEVDGPKRPPWQIPVAIGVVVGLIVGLIFFLLGQYPAATTAPKAETSQAQPQPLPQPKDDAPDRHSPPESPAPETTKPEATKPEASGPETTNPEPTDPEPADPGAVAPEKTPSDPQEPESVAVPVDPGDEPGEQPAGPEVLSPAFESGRSLGDLIDPADPSDPGSGGPQPHDRGVSTKLPVADKEARQEAEKKIRDIFKTEFADAGTAEKKAALAAKLFIQGQQTADDPTARFVLMQLACQISAEAGELTAALDRVDQMQQIYDLDPLAFKAYLLEKVIGSMRPGRNESNQGTAANNREIVQTAMQLIDEAVAVDDFTAAARFSRAASTIARKSKDSTLIRRMTIRNRELDRQKQRFAAARQALDVLAEKPRDAAANLTAGRYYCFYAGDWEKGLPMLAKSNDPILVKLAQRDVELCSPGHNELRSPRLDAPPADLAKQVRLADDWWDLAEKQAGLVKPAMRYRAAYWYRQALPALTGLSRAKAEKRLEALAAGEDAAAKTARGVVQKGNLALAANGTTVDGKITWADKLLDGRVEYLKNSYAWGDCPCQWIIRFDQVYRLREIRFLLWDQDPRRRYRYTVEVSADGQTFAPLADRSLGNWAGWQQILFSPRPVKAIRLTGLYGSAMNRFYVIEFEAYCISRRAKP